MKFSMPKAECRMPNRKSGFTLIEVLVALLFIAIVLPALMQGISVASGMASDARHRTEAAGLAQSKLAEIVTAAAWQSGVSSGDFGTDWPGYRWQLAVSPWTSDQTGQNVQQLDVTVTYNSRGSDRTVKLSTLAYQRSTQ